MRKNNIRIIIHVLIVFQRLNLAFIGSLALNRNHTEIFLNLVRFTDSVHIKGLRRVCKSITFNFRVTAHWGNNVFLFDRVVRKPDLYFV